MFDASARHQFNANDLDNGSPTSRLRAVTAEPTPPTAKSPAARRVGEQMASLGIFRPAHPPTSRKPAEKPAEKCWQGFRKEGILSLIAAPVSHPRDPLHGITLENILNQLLHRHGWDEMGRRINIRCFQFNPTVKSSLTFLRKTPWARKQVEDWFISELLPK